MILYACSTNKRKLREFALAGASIAGLRIEALPTLHAIEPPEETGTTFEENAVLKAAYYSRYTNEYVFADDSGIEADALDGAPGVYSARYAGPNATDEENNHLLLRNLEDKPNRHGRFVCVIALARAGQLITTFRAAAEGEIMKEEHGKGGFGYDPLFFYPPLNKSFAELTPEEKFAVSHRGQALRKLLEFVGSPEVLSQSIALLQRFPASLDALVRNLPPFWTLQNEGGQTWNVFDIVAHLVSAERTNWIPRIRHILDNGESKTLTTFDRTPKPDGKTMPQLLDDFAELRNRNLDELRAMNLSREDLAHRGRHPRLGSVTVSEIIATWASHDLTHLHQISRVMAHQFRDAVGPIKSFLGVLRCNAHGE